MALDTRRPPRVGTRHALAARRRPPRDRAAGRPRGGTVADGRHVRHQGRLRDDHHPRELERRALRLRARLLRRSATAAPLPLRPLAHEFLVQARRPVPGERPADVGGLRLGHDHLPLGRLVREGRRQGHRERAPLLRAQVRPPVAYLPLGTLRRRHGDVHRHRVRAARVRRRAADVRYRRGRAAELQRRVRPPRALRIRLPRRSRRTVHLSHLLGRLRALPRRQRLPERRDVRRDGAATSARGRSQRRVHRASCSSTPIASTRTRRHPAVDSSNAR